MPSNEALRQELETLTTEAFRPELAEIDRLPTAEIVRLMNGEDATVPAAVAMQLPRIAAAIDDAAERMARGGRLVYAGAGTAGRLGVLDASECPPTFNSVPGQVTGLIAGGLSAMVTSIEGAEDSKELAAADLDALGLGATDTVVGVVRLRPHPVRGGRRRTRPGAGRVDRRPVLQRGLRSSPRPPTTASRSWSDPSC